VRSLELEEGVVYKAWLKGLAFPVQLLKKVFKNENGTTGTLYLVSNDMHCSAERLYEVYQKRWRIGVSRLRTLHLVGESPTEVKGSSLVAREASWRESKTMEPSDNILRKEYAQCTRL
jgi:hypothetical protein